MLFKHSTLTSLLTTMHQTLRREVLGSLACSLPILPYHSSKGHATRAAGIAHLLDPSYAPSSSSPSQLPMSTAMAISTTQGFCHFPTLAPSSLLKAMHPFWEHGNAYGDAMHAMSY